MSSRSSDPRSATPGRSETHTALAEQADPEAEDLIAVVGALDDRKAKVESDRNRAQSRDDDAKADARGDAVVGDVDVAFDGAAVDEADEIKVVVGANRYLILDAIEPHEIAADVVAIFERADAAKLEAAETAETTGIEAFEDRRVAARP